MPDYVPTENTDPRRTNAKRAIADYEKNPSPVNARGLARADSELGLAKIDGINIEDLRKTIDTLLP